MKYIFLLLLIIGSFGIFFAFVKPRYSNVQSIRTEVANYNSNLATADKLKQSREELIAQYNSISKIDLDNIKVLLPDSVDNIRLIIQIDSLATKNGLSSLRNVDYQTEDKKTTSGTPAAAPGVEGVRKPYGEFVINFQTVGQYPNLLNFISDLERNLRLVDITNVEFGVGEEQATNTSSHNYKVTLKTYWLRQ